MLFPQKILEVLFIVPRERTDLVLPLIAKNVELMDFHFPKLRKTTPNRILVVELLSKLESFISELPSEKVADKVKDPIEETVQISKLLENKMKELAAKKRDLEYNKRKYEIMNRLLDSSEFIGIIQIFTESVENWENVRTKLQEKNVRIVGTTSFEHEVLVLAKGTDKGFVGDEKRVREKIENELKKFEQLKIKLENEKKDLAEKFGPRLNVLKNQLEAEIELLEEKKKIAHSELFTFIRGKVKEKGLEKIKVDALMLGEKEGKHRKKGLNLKNYWRRIKSAVVP